MVLPMDYSVFIPNDDSVRLLRYILGLLNLSALYNKYQDTFKIKEGRPRYNCFVLLSVIVYGYQQGLYSSRQIARACKRDINFMWLLNGEAVPSHNLINRFRKHILDEVIEDIFYQMIKYLEEVG